MVSHSMDDLAALADRIAVLNEGRLLMEGSPREVFLRADELERVGLGVPAAQHMAGSLIARGVPLDARRLYGRRGARAPTSRTWLRRAPGRWADGGVLLRKLLPGLRRALPARSAHQAPRGPGAPCHGARQPPPSGRWRPSPSSRRGSTRSRAFPPAGRCGSLAPLAAIVAVVAVLNLLTNHSGPGPREPLDLPDHRGQRARVPVHGRAHAHHDVRDEPGDAHHHHARPHLRARAPAGALRTARVCRRTSWA